MKLKEELTMSNKEMYEALVRALNRCWTLAGYDPDSLTRMTVSDTIQEIAVELSAMDVRFDSELFVLEVQS